MERERESISSGVVRIKVVQGSRGGCCVRIDPQRDGEGERKREGRSFLPNQKRRIEKRGKLEWEGKRRTRNEQEERMHSEQLLNCFSSFSLLLSHLLPSLLFSKPFTATTIDCYCLCTVKTIN